MIILSKIFIFLFLIFLITGVLSVIEDDFNNPDTERKMFGKDSDE
jgi:hypothetical protein